MFVIETPVLPSNWFDISMVAHPQCYMCCHLASWFFMDQLLLLETLFSLILSTQVVLMLIAQYTVLSSISPGHRNWLEVVGVMFVLIGSSLSSLLETLADNK